MSDNVYASLGKPYNKEKGLGTADLRYPNAGYDNNVTRRWRSANGLSVIDALAIDADNILQLGAQAMLPMRQQITLNLQPNALQGTQSFFIADRPYYITGLTERHATAATTAGTVTAQVTIDSSGTAAGAGTAMMSNTFNLKATANTAQSATLAASHLAADLAAVSQPAGVPFVQSVITLKKGDRLTFVTSTATLTSLAGVQLTLELAPAAKTTPAIWNMLPNGSLAAAQQFFLANREHVVVGASVCWGTAGTDPGTVTVDITNDTSTNAPGAGSTILSAVQSLKGAANTPVFLSLTSTAANLNVLAGNRLSVKLNGTLTALANVTVCVYLAPLYNELTLMYYLTANGQLGTASTLFTADREYEVADLSEIHSTASGGVYKVALTKDSPTQSPGSGVVLQTDNTNAGFDLNGTAQTVQIGTLAARRNRILYTGDSIGMVFSGAGGVGSLAGLLLSVNLIPR